MLASCSPSIFHQIYWSSIYHHSLEHKITFVLFSWQYPSTISLTSVYLEFTMRLPEFSGFSHPAPIPSIRPAQLQFGREATEVQNELRMQRIRELQRCLGCDLSGAWTIHDYWVFSTNMQKEYTNTQTYTLYARTCTHASVACFLVGGYVAGIYKQLCRNIAMYR